MQSHSRLNSTNMTEVEAERLECATLRGDKADLEQSLAARSAEVQTRPESKERLDKELKNTQTPRSENRGAGGPPSGSY